jgi:UDP-N-acetylglucosamine 2-epimerase (non-hydrolysing)
MRVMSVVGARPQFVKLAPIDWEFRRRGIEHIIVHTGQHYDANMSDSFFAELDIAKPNFNLHVGSGSHASQTAAMLPPLEALYLEHKPSWVLAYGDTNSTLASAIVAAKVHQKLAHLEAGLRSFNRAMPEEINRIVTDHTSDLLLAPTQVAMDHLKREGLENRSVLVGDVMTDICLATSEKYKDQMNLNEEFNLDKNYYLATIHRAENTDDPTKLASIINLLESLGVQVLLTMHPRLIQKLEDHDISISAQNIVKASPLTYPEMVVATSNAMGVITDSGGLQKEAFLLKTPCVTLRSETEWVETTKYGKNLVGLNPSPNQVNSFINEVNSTRWGEEVPYGTGNAASNVASELENRENEQTA